MSLRCMIVDDTRFMRMMLTDILKKLGNEIVGEADNGARGVELYKELKPDLVFMDISMPGMDGVQALGLIREADSQAVVIICSAISQQDMIANAMNKGAAGYVMKPFKPKQIKEAVDKFLETNRMPEAIESAAKLAVAEEPIVKRSAADKSIAAEDSVVEDSVVKDTVVKDTVVEDTVVEDSVVEVLVVEDSVVEEPLLEVPVLEMPVSQEPVLDEPVMEGPVWKETVAEGLLAFQTLDDEVIADWDSISLEPEHTEPGFQFDVSDGSFVDINGFSIDVPINLVMEDELSSLFQEETLGRRDTFPIDRSDRLIHMNGSAGLIADRGQSSRPGVVTEFKEVWSCKWKEAWDSDEKVFTASYSEGDRYIVIDGASTSSGSALLSIDGLRNLLEWIDKKAVRN